jgi:HD-like signal output (HDOD) protein
MSPSPPDLSAVLQAPVVLPSQPRTVALLLSELRTPQPSMRRLDQLFATDPALSARLLAAANSPAHLLERRVSGIPEALVVLGLEQLRELVAQAPLGLGAGWLQGLELPDFWRYSVEVAKLARALAASVQANAATAYALGLVHGVGELFMHGADARGAAGMNETAAVLHPNRARLELRLYGYSYSQVSAALAGAWNLPPVVVQALLHMQAPMQQAQFEPLTGVLHLACWRVRARAADWDERKLAVSFPAEVGLALGLDIDMVLRQASIDWHAGGGLDVLL